MVDTDKVVAAILAAASISGTGVTDPKGCVDHYQEILRLLEPTHTTPTQG